MDKSKDLKTIVLHVCSTVCSNLVVSKLKCYIQESRSCIVAGGATSSSSAEGWPFCRGDPRAGTDSRHGSTWLLDADGQGFLN